MTMTTTLDCLPCFVRQAVEAAGFCVPDNKARTALVRRLLTDLGAMDWSLSPVEISQRLHRTLREAAGTADPYQAMKARMNRLAAELLPCMRMAARYEEDPRMALVRLCVAGNLIDAGAKGGVTDDRGIREALCRTSREPLLGSAADLFAAAERARRILFLADNAGEIVFDRALIEALPAGRVTVAVRGTPVLNDATLEDARTAGLTDLAPVIPNGSDAPGTLLPSCSPAFRRAYAASDLVIAKGQGNYESLDATGKHVFYLLRVKCPLVASRIGAPVGSLVVHEQRPETAVRP